MARKLEIGPGDNPVGTERWEFIGFEAQWGYKSLPYPDATFDEVYASHVLEHVPWTHTNDALAEAHRILKPKGLLELWVPNFAYIVQCYLDQAPGDKWRRYNPEGDFMRWVNGRIFTYGPDESNWHHACFDPEYLRACVEKAGFNCVEIIGRRKRGAPHGEIDLGVKAIK